MKKVTDFLFCEVRTKKEPGRNVVHNLHLSTVPGICVQMLFFLMHFQRHHQMMDHDLIGFGTITCF